MNKYKIFKPKVFQSLEKFERNLNEECRKGYKPISIASEGGVLVVLLEKVS